MPNRDNKTVIYAQKQLGLKPDGSGGTYNTLFGIQEVGNNANVSLERIFEFGQLGTYATQEELPDVEWSLTKVLDGSPLIYFEATRDVTGPTLRNRSVGKTILGMGIFPDTTDNVTGNPPALVESSGLFVSSISYEIGVDGPMTENVTLIGNDQIWRGDYKITNTSDIARANALTYLANSAFANNNDTPASGNVQRRENIIFSYAVGSGLDVNNQVKDPDATILPPDVDGISPSGTNEEYLGAYNASIQSITISTDLSRENINELGRRGPYFRRPTFPVDVTCAIEIVSKSGDMTSFTERGIYSNGSLCSPGANTKDRTIRIATCYGERFYLGTKNRLTSVNNGGGGVDGSFGTITYNFTNNNDFTVMASYDPNPNAAGWWTARSNYLTN